MATQHGGIRGLRRPCHLAMINTFRLHAKWTRRVPRPAPPKAPLKARSDDIPVDIMQYMRGHIHLADVWAERKWFELEWFLLSLRGLLPEEKKKVVKNYQIHHVHLKPEQYFLALETLTTRLGVKLT